MSSRGTKRSRTSYGGSSSSSSSSFPQKALFKQIKQHKYSNNNRTGGSMGIELKYRDLHVNDTVLYVSLNAGTNLINRDPDNVLCVNGVPQGNSANQRIGTRYTMKSLHIRGHLMHQPSNAGGYHEPHSVVARIVVYIDTQNNASTTQPIPTTILQSVDVGTQEDLYAYRNLQYTNRYKILYDKLFTMKPNAAYVGGTQSYNGATKHLWSMNAKIPAKYATVDCTTAGISGNLPDITNNAIHVMAYTDEGATGQNRVYIGYVSRLRYIG